MMLYRLLSTAQKLSLAITLERSKARRNRFWSRLFRHYDPGTAMVLRALSEDEARRSRHLAGVYRRRYGQPPDPVHASVVAEILPVNQEFSLQNDVADDESGRTVLRSALQDERSTCAYFEDLVSTTIDPDLRGVYRPLAGADSSHVELLTEKLDTY